jgi:uncharacterized membrane protein
MIEGLPKVLTFTAAIGCGVVGGIFYAFSTFVMAALARLPPPQGIAAMNSINVTVINPLFFLAFFGTGAVCLALVAGAWFWGDAVSGRLILIASFAYLVGCIGVTMVFNVPLNNALAAVDANTPAGAALWQRYLADWTMWNHVRTVVPIVSAILFTAALM